MEARRSEKGLRQQYTDEEQLCLEELCTSNGLEFSEKANYKEVQSIELFSNGILVIPPLKQFNNLIQLCLVGHQISKIRHLEALNHLEELWLCDCSIKVIENLDTNFHLKKVYLYENEIERIQNISHLKNLEILWLNGNRIAKLEGISMLENLKDLNISENLITSIGNSFENNKMLETLNLSGNMISSIKDTTNLGKLPKLRSLSLKDPLYRANPVALLCNYAFHILYHLPHLTSLDSNDVSQKTLKEIAEATVMKKKMYYQMKQKTLERGYNETVKKLEEKKESVKNVSTNVLKKLNFAIKEIERELEELNVPSRAMSFAIGETKEKAADQPESDKRSAHQDEDNHGETEPENAESDSASEDDLGELLERVNVRKEKLKSKLKTLKDRVIFWEKRDNSVEISHKEICRQARNLVDHNSERLMLELETVGNVRFENGTPSDPWFGAVHDLFMSRFSELDFRDLPVTSLKIHRIIRIYNKSRHLLFDDKLETLSRKDESLLISRDDNRVIDYLFNIWDHNHIENSKEIFSKIENGFECGPNGSVQLTNSIGVADKPRLRHIMKRNSEKSSNEKLGFRFGQILVCKTFLGRSCKVSKNDKKICKSQYQNYDSGYQTKRHAICPTKAKSKSTVAISELCDCTLRRCTWHVFDNELIVPEYLVEFEYGSRTTDPLAAALSSILDEGGKKQTTNNVTVNDSSSTDDRLAHTDENILNMEPNVKSRPRLTVLTEDLLLKHTGASYVNRITSLDLNGSGLSKLKPLSTLFSLKKLIVSFNELTSLQDLSGMSNLEYLDASFNKISSIDGFKGCIHVVYLDLSWNKLHYTREEVGLIRKYLPAVKSLNLKHNPWLKPETIRMRCIGRLRNLMTMDNEMVTEEETALAMRMAACSRIAYVTILAHSRTDTEKPRTLSLAPTADVLMSKSRNKPVKFYEDDKKWFYTVTCLQLDDQHLSKISNLENLENLRFVSFNNNDITKIEGLESCPNIEELSLVGNCISKLEGIDHLLKLQVLNLDNNNLMSLDATHFDKLLELKHLSLENNLITRLKSLQKSRTLCDLYLGNNKIANMREIFNLKNITTLSILDLVGNPMTSESSDYRLFTIYHLQSLRALDGVPVDQVEEGIARETYGGRLTQDFVAERLGHSNFVEVCELDLPNQGLRNIDLGNGDSFNYLTSVNLEHNNLTHFGGLIYLNNLKVLCLNFNHIESIVGKPKASQTPSSPSQIKGIIEITNPEFNTPVLDKLQVLHLGFNGISNIATLQLGRLRNLKTLFLQGNEIAKVDGLDGVKELRELVLDKNKIKSFSEYSFVKLWKVTELHCEENRLRELSNLEPLVNLQRLYIGLNRIQESAEIEKLERLSNLVELSVIGNPVSRRLMHRPMLVFRQPNLLSIDGIPVTNEERTKAELYFLEQQGGVQLLQTLAGAANLSLPGINASVSKPTGQVPLKVTQVQLSGNTPEFAYQFGQRLHDHFQNLSPPPYSGADYSDHNTKRKKSGGRKDQNSGNKKSGNFKESSSFESNKSTGRR